MAGFTTNAAAGSFTIRNGRNGRNYTTAGAFGNAGIVNVGLSSTFTATGAFSDQASSQIQMAGGNLAGAAVGNAGQISGFGNVANTGSNTGSVAVGAGSTLALGAASTARTLTNNGTLLSLGANNITVSQDCNNASFGVGNAFNFGSMRVGDSVTARNVGLTNTATGALADTLRASLGSAGAPFTSSGTVSGLTAGSSNNSTLNVQLATATAGTYTGAALVTFTSQNPDLADLALGASSLTLKAQVNNLASAALGKTAGAGSFSAAGLNYTLNFGTLLQGTGAATASLSLANIAAGPADALGGSWDLSALGSGYALSGFGSFAGLAAGAALSGLSGLSVSFNDSAIGTFNRVVTLRGISTHGSGPNLALADVTLNLQGTVAAVSEPGSYLLFAGGLAVLGWARRRQFARAARARV